MKHQYAQTTSSSFSKSTTTSALFTTNLALEQAKTGPRPRRFRFDSYVLAQAALIGILTGCSVSVFKLSIEALKAFFYTGPSNVLVRHAMLRPLIPALGGLIVGLLGLFGPFSPGLKGTLEEADSETANSNEIQSSPHSFRFLRKTLAAVVTLGTGCSLGPEGPSVEVGMNVAKIATNSLPTEYWYTRQTRPQALQRKRILLSCGAAAGVAAGFEAPLAGVFFALEIVQSALPPLPEEPLECDVTYNDGDEDYCVEDKKCLLSSTRNIGALLLSSVLAAMCTRSIMGKHTVFYLSDYHLRTPQSELPLYLLLGSLSGCAAFVFKKTTLNCNSFFQGDLGPGRLRNVMKKIPQIAKPLIGGLFCGLVGLVFPQIIFFGYDTLNSLLANSAMPMPTSLLLALLGVKTLVTAVSSGSGLVGGTFAPSLFLGGMLGGSFHNIVNALLRYGAGGGHALFQIADLPAYVMVGSGSMMAAIFGAPLTAGLLMFELTQDYDVLLPLMASAAVGNVVSDVLESKFGNNNDR